MWLGNEGRDKRLYENRIAGYVISLTYCSYCLYTTLEICFVPLHEYCWYGSWFSLSLDSRPKLLNGAQETLVTTCFCRSGRSWGKQATKAVKPKAINHRDRQTKTRIHRGRTQCQVEEAEVLTEENQKSVGRKKTALATCFQSNV